MLKYVLLIFLVTSCILPKDNLIKEFGLFINETEANYKNYDDSEWNITQLNFIDFKQEFEELKVNMDNDEINQIKSYIKRFKKVEVRKDPLNNILEIFK
jgi:hypothetical protein